MVFAPAPLLTVTIEQSIAAPELHVHAGGQGIWQARMITALGCSVVMCVAVGGETGRILRDLLTGDRMTARAVQREADSGWYVHDRRDGGRSTVAEHPGAPMTRHDMDELYSLTLAEGLRAAVSVLSGPADHAVIDADVYRRLAADLTANGARVVADLSGDLLTAVLAGGVEFLKVSHEELLADGRASDDSVAALGQAARQLRADGAGSVLISRADQPSLALLDDELVEVTMPPLQVVDHRGAGDSLTAGVAAVLAQGGDLREAVRVGAAAGGVNVTRHGLGTGRAEAVTELARRVTLTPAGEG